MYIGVLYSFPEKILEAMKAVIGTERTAPKLLASPEISSIDK